MAIIVYPGKGGTGKTTLSALTVRYFKEKGELTLALDFDPDSHLYKLLGVEIRSTIGRMVDRIHKEKKAELEPKKPIDVSDQEYFFFLVAEEVLVEGEGFDLLTLGKPFIDIDCYCPAFLWSEYAITQVMKSYGLTYGHIVVDCDPGTEIFPRKSLDSIAQHSTIDYILTVLDGSKMSFDTAKEIMNEVERRRLKVRRIAGVCNRVDDQELQRRIKETARDDYGIEIVGFVPTDPVISRHSLSGESILKLPESPSYKAVKEVMKTLSL